MIPENPLQHPKSKSETSQRLLESPPTSRLPKTHEDYWKQRLKRRTYATADGSKRLVPEWQVQMSHNGQQKWINLETSNREVAAKKARDAWVKLRAEGWQGLRPAKAPRKDLDVGTYLAAVQAEADLSPPLLGVRRNSWLGILRGPSQRDLAVPFHQPWR
jgi:hypothetical protein